MVLRLSAVLLTVLLTFSACADRMRNKDQVQAAIVERLQTRSGLDLNTIDITTTSVNFDKNKAFATVAFHPKGDSNVNSGMIMKYTLEDRDGKWVVVSVNDSQGHGIGGRSATSSGQLPPGHPSLDQMPQSSSTQLPPGHPALNSASQNEAVDRGGRDGQGSHGRAQ